MYVQCMYVLYIQYVCESGSRAPGLAETAQSAAQTSFVHLGKTTEKVINCTNYFQNRSKRFDAGVSHDLTTVSVWRQFCTVMYMGLCL